MTRRILVVDDEADVRACVQGLLSLLPDCHIEGAASFQEGRSRAGEEWDLVISDFSLPDGNGVDLLAACAREHPATPRVLMSAHEAHPQVVAALRSAMLSAFIAKPFDPDAVLDRVEQLLDRPLSA